MWPYRNLSHVNLGYNPDIFLLEVALQNDNLTGLTFVGRERNGDTLTITTYERIAFFIFLEENQVRRQFFQIAPDIKYIRVGKEVYWLGDIPTIYYHQSRGKREHNEIR